MNCVQAAPFTYNNMWLSQIQLQCCFMDLLNAMTALLEYITTKIEPLHGWQVVLSQIIL